MRTCRSGICRVREGFKRSGVPPQALRSPARRRAAWLRFAYLGKLDVLGVLTQIPAVAAFPCTGRGGGAWRGGGGIRRASGLRPGERRHVRVGFRLWSRCGGDGPDFAHFGGWSGRCSPPSNRPLASGRSGRALGWPWMKISPPGLNSPPQRPAGAVLRAGGSSKPTRQMKCAFSRCGGRW